MVTEMYPKEVGKGKSSDDGTYLYTCNACNGTGKHDGDVCAWCYGLDTARIVSEMKAGARGQRYYGLLKAFLSVNGVAMVNMARGIEKLTPVDLGYISLQFGLNLKATVEWLEECHCIYSGVYEKLMASGYTVKAIYAKAREKYGIQEGGDG